MMTEDIINIFSVIYFINTGYLRTYKDIQNSSVFSSALVYLTDFSSVFSSAFMMKYAHSDNRE